MEKLENAVNGIRRAQAQVWQRKREVWRGDWGAYSLLYIIQMFPVANLPLLLLLPYTFTSIKCWARPDSALPASVKVLTNCTCHMLHNTFINVSHIVIIIL